MDFLLLVFSENVRAISKSFFLVAEGLKTPGGTLSIDGKLVWPHACRGFYKFSMKVGKSPVQMEA